MQGLLDDRLRTLVDGLKGSQRENKEVEEEALEKLGLLKDLNNELEGVYRDKVQSVNQLK